MFQDETRDDPSGTVIGRKPIKVLGAAKFAAHLISGATSFHSTPTRHQTSVQAQSAL